MLISAFVILITVVSGNTAVFSNLMCIGGSQVLPTEFMKQSISHKFPANDPEHRACLFRNMCIINGSLTYFVDRKNQPLSDFLPEGFGGNMYHTGHLRGFTLPIKTVEGPIPDSIPFDDSKLAFVDANSWSFNYGHYLIDNVLTSFIAAKVFNFPFSETQQILESKCRLFRDLPADFSSKIVDYNHSLGTYQQACLERFSMWPSFYDNPPMFMDEMTGKDRCFKKIIAGQGSCFSLKSLVLSRASIMREWRDFVLARMAKKAPLPARENLILVGLRTAGSAGGSIIGNLCDVVTESLTSISSNLRLSYRVECIYPSNYNLEEEIRYAQRAKMIITVHGTISYLSLFTKEGTQQLSIANPTEYKENQIIMWGTHMQLHYLTWDRMKELSSVMENALTNSEEYFANETD